MEALNKLNKWLDENPAAPDWNRDDVPIELSEELRAAYYNDPVGFKTALAGFPQWTIKEVKDNDEDTHGFIVILCTHHGEVISYTNREVFQSMGETINWFTKLNTSWYGRLWIRFVFWLDSRKSEKGNRS